MNESEKIQKKAIFHPGKIADLTTGNKTRLVSIRDDSSLAMNIRNKFAEFNKNLTFVTKKFYHTFEDTIKLHKILF